MSKLVRENINDYLPAPSEEDIEKRLENTNLNPNELLKMSATNGYIKGIKNALKQGADINTGEDVPLSRAVYRGHFDAVKYLINNGAKINRNVIRLSLLHNNVDIVKYLLERTSVDKSFLKNALKNAKINKSYDVVKYLKSQIKE